MRPITFFPDAFALRCFLCGEESSDGSGGISPNNERNVSFCVFPRELPYVVHPVLNDQHLFSA